MSPNFHHGAVERIWTPAPTEPACIYARADLPSGQYVVCPIELGSSS